MKSRFVKLRRVYALTLVLVVSLLAPLAGTAGQSSYTSLLMCTSQGLVSVFVKLSADQVDNFDALSSYEPSKGHQAKCLLCKLNDDEADDTIQVSTFHHTYSKVLRVSELLDDVFPSSTIPNGLFARGPPVS